MTNEEMVKKIEALEKRVSDLDYLVVIHQVNMQYLQEKNYVKLNSNEKIFLEFMESREFTCNPIEPLRKFQTSKEEDKKFKKVKGYWCRWCEYAPRNGGQCDK